LDKKEAGRPITSEDYFTLTRLVRGIEGQIIAARAARHDEIRQARNEARKQIPAVAWTLPLDDLDLPGRVHNLLLDNEIETVGDVLYNMELGDHIFLNFKGFGEVGLQTLKDAVAAYELPAPARRTLRLRLKNWKPSKPTWKKRPNSKPRLKLKPKSKKRPKPSTK
jgi:hypothetical protein